MRRPRVRRVRLRRDRLVHRPRLPAVLGHEVVGTVRAVGTGVDGAPVRRPAWRSTTTPRAASAGVAGAATRRCASAFARPASTPGGSPSACASARSWSASCSSSPTAIDAITATFIEPLACVLRSQDRAGLRAGDSLLVVGAGVNGLLQIAAAHARGVEAVWVREPRRGATRARRGIRRRAPRQRARRRRDRVHAQARGDRVGGGGGGARAARSASTRRPRPTRLRSSTPPPCTSARSPLPRATRPAPPTCGPRSR